jgi:hypothetical protein
MESYSWEYENSQKSKKFWMITGDGNQPRVRHANKKQAVDEAKRLAKNNPGVEFYILETVKLIEQPSQIKVVDL